ncbi:hypothetical protein [Streptomyces caeruleatus]|uniref:Uncharacterized protein n=1 Tax=Streptomyces caeruleatus TaxID=661399 RepID=A0A101TLD6_9ACTN|nr:hypothetical protein [Streptomyces caeruleatus]KUN94482.1 hypothetical protein AQJ67_36710 [Streptomyces caeruleatus]
MIQQVEHTSTGAGAADIALALAVAGALHAPTAPSRAPELATARLSAGRRTAAARGRRRTVRG